MTILGQHLLYLSTYLLQWSFRSFSSPLTKEEFTATDTTHLDEMIHILSLKIKWKLLASTVLQFA